MVEVQN